MSKIAELHADEELSHDCDGPACPIHGYTGPWYDYELDELGLFLLSMTMEDKHTHGHKTTQPIRRPISRI